jgi:protocatechuate 3,4-dioxygenase beta subunit
MKLTLLTTSALVTTLALAGCTPSQTSSTTGSSTVSSPAASGATTATAETATTCTGTVSASPALTEGPYYKAGDFVRSDITEGQSGMPMTLTLTVVDTNCQPIPNATVDIWHANALGQYSGVSDPKEGCAECVDQTFLRGTQTTNAQGQVTFQSIFPGWYPGRTVHIHVKVWQDGQQVLTTQLFVSKADADSVYATAGYKGEQNTTNEQDRIAQQAGANLAGLTLVNNFTTSSDAATAQLVIG